MFGFTFVVLGGNVYARARHLSGRILRGLEGGICLEDRLRLAAKTHRRARLHFTVRLSFGRVKF